MTLPSTRLTSILAGIGPDPVQLAQSLRAARLLGGVAAPHELETFIRTVLAQPAQGPSQPGLVWADRLSAALQERGHLNRVGLRWASSPPASSRLPRVLLLLVCAWWGITGTVTGVLAIRSSASPEHLGPVLLAFGLASLLATFAIARRLAWAPRLLQLVAGLGILAGLAIAFAVSYVIPLPTGLTAAGLGAICLLWLAWWGDGFVRREAISAG